MSKALLAVVVLLLLSVGIDWMGGGGDSVDHEHSVNAFTLLVVSPTRNEWSRRIQTQSQQPQPYVTNHHHRVLRSTTEDKSDVIVSNDVPTTTTTTTETVTTAPPILQPLNPAVYTIQPSKTVAIFSLVKQMEATQPGMKVTSLSVGEPDFSPPPSVIQSMITFMNTSATTINQATKYTAVSGLLSLRQAIAKDLQTRKNITYQPNTDILIANGAKQAVYQAIWAMAGINDVVFIPSPYWPSYPEEVRLTGAQPMILPTTMENGYRLTATILEQALQEYPNTKVLILCNPCNPTGTVYSEYELNELCHVLQSYPNVTVIADEIYERLVYTDGPTHVSIASIPNMYHRTITINGFSKSHAMTGLRIGYSCAPPHITTAMTTLQSQLTSCANAISQYAAIAALEETPEIWMTNVIQTMQQKRDYVIERLKCLPYVSISNEYPPTGAFYILPDIRRYCRTNSITTDHESNEPLYDDVDFCLQLLEQEQLAIVPGTSFGLSGTVRLSYATSMEELQVAMNKFENYLNRLRIERPEDFME